MNDVLKFLIKLNADSDNLVTATRKVREQLTIVEQGAERVGAAIKRAFSPGSFGASLMSIPGMQFLTNPYTLIGAGIGAVAKLGAEAEMTATAFTALVGEEQKANEMLKEIKSSAASALYGNMKLAENAKLMMNAGMSPDKVTTYLSQLGDIAGGDAQKLSSLSLVLGQVFSAGKLLGTDKNQFINAGFNPLKELAKMTGKSYEEIDELMGKGMITAENVAQAIAHATSEGGQFHGITEKLAETVSGKFNAALAQLQEGMLGLFERLKPYLTKLIDAMAKAIPPVMGALINLFETIEKVISWVEEWKAELLLAGTILGIFTVLITAKTIAIWGYATAMAIVRSATTAWTAVQWLLNAAMTANPIGLVIALIAALVAAVVYCWNKFAGFRAFIITAWETFKELGSILKDYVLDRINGIIRGLGALGKAIGHLFSGEWSEAWSSAKEGYQELTGIRAAQSAADKLVGFRDRVSQRWQDNLTAERAKQDAKDKEPSLLETLTGGGIKTPELKGSATPETVTFGTGKGKSGKGGKDGSAIATGGQRNTQITMTIGKLVEAMNIHMMDKGDSAELERMVVDTLNRSLAIATSTDR